MTETLDELRSLTTEELIRRYDGHSARTTTDINHYLQELARRGADRQMRTLVLQTWAIVILTVLTTTLTALNAVLVARTLK